MGEALTVGPMAALKDSYHHSKDPAIGDDAKASLVHVAGGMRKVLIAYHDVALQKAAGQTASNIVAVSVAEKPGVQAIGNT